MANENMDMKRMQEEAIHRVQEMPNRANQQLRGTPSLLRRQRTNRSNNGPSFQVELTEIILKTRSPHTK